MGEADARLLLCRHRELYDGKTGDVLFQTCNTKGTHLGSPPGGTVLGTASTTKTLYSAQSEVVVLPLSSPPAGLLNGSETAYAAVAVPDSVHECRADNNTSAPVTAQCGVPK